MPKAKGTPGGNPNPVQTPEFLEKQFPAAADLPDGVELAKVALCVKLPVELDAIVRSLPNRSAWIRQAIVEKLERENLVSGEVEPAVQAIAPQPAAEPAPRRRGKTEPAPKTTHKRQRVSSTRQVVVNLDEDEDEPELEPETLIRNPAGDRGWVDRRLENGRYQVTFENGLTDDYPRRLLRLPE